MVVHVKNMGSVCRSSCFVIHMKSGLHEKVLSVQTKPSQPLTIFFASISAQPRQNVGLASADVHSSRSINLVSDADLQAQMT